MKGWNQLFASWKPTPEVHTGDGTAGKCMSASVPSEYFTQGDTIQNISL